MTRVKHVAGLVLAAVLLWAAGGWAAEAPIGVVDFQRILDESTAGKAAQASINKKGKEMEGKLKARGKELEEMKQQLQREALVMSREMREEKEREFRIKINDFKEMQKTYAQTARELQLRAMADIRKEVDTLATAIGEKEGMSLVIEKQEAGVLYFQPKADLTAKVIERYDAEFARKAAAGATNQ